MTFFFCFCEIWSWISSSLENFPYFSTIKHAIIIIPSALYITIYDSKRKAESRTIELKSRIRNTEVKIWTIPAKTESLAIMVFHCKKINAIFDCNKVGTVTTGCNKHFYFIQWNIGFYFHLEISVFLCNKSTFNLWQILANHIGVDIFQLIRVLNWTVVLGLIIESLCINLIRIWLAIKLLMHIICNSYLV